MSSFTIKGITLPEWVRDNKKLRPLIAAAAVLLFIDLLLYAAVVLPSGDRLRAQETRVSDLRKRRTEAVLFRKQKQQLAGIKAGIISQKDMPLLVKELVQNARRLNLTVAPINYDIPKRSGEDLALLTFSFPAQGRYADIKRFVYEVETSDRLIGIQDLKMNEGDKGRVDIQMKLMTYVKGQ